MLKYLFAFGLLVLLPIMTLQNGIRYHAAKFLVPGETHIQKAQSLVQRYTNKNPVQLFCWTEELFSFWTIFKSNRLHLEIEYGAEYNQYKEETAHKISLAHEQGQEWAEGKAMAAEDKYINLKTNSPGCYGLYTNHAFKLTLETTNIDKWRVTKFCLGFLLWRAALRVEASRRCLYGLAAFLGFQLGTWITIYATGHLRLVLEGSLSTAMHEVFNERPKMLARAFCGCWCALFLVCQRFNIRHTRHINRCILRGIACWLIFSASDHQSIGLFCVLCIFCHPIIWAMLRSKPPAGQEINQQQHPQQHANLMAEDSVVWSIPASPNSVASLGAGAVTSTPIIQAGTSATQGTGTSPTGQDPVIYHISGDSLILRGRSQPIPHRSPTDGCGGLKKLT